MRIGVLGTGTVGTTIGSRLVELGHDVMLGSRTADNEAATAWAAESGGSNGTFADAAAHGELVFNCTSGAGSLAALEAAGADNLAGKTLVDVVQPARLLPGLPAEPLGLQHGQPGRADPARPPRREGREGAEHDERVGDGRPVARRRARTPSSSAETTRTRRPRSQALLGEFGWPESAQLDLGNLIAARGMEMWLPLWLSIYGALGTGTFNVRRR